MRIQTIEGSREKQILTGMIVSTSVCGRIANRWDGSLFRSSWANLVGGWCVGYLQKYDEAPKKRIKSLFERWANKNGDGTTIDLIERFLAELSDDYEGMNHELNESHLVDLAGEYFTQVRLEKLVEQVQGDLETGNGSEAEIKVNEWASVQLGENEWIDIFQDNAAIKDALETQTEDVLIRYPGAAGEFFGDDLCRDGFVAFMAPDKRGKTFWLLDIAFRAALQRRRVAFFEGGDMSLKQITRRFATRIARWPRKARMVKCPISITRDPEEKLAYVEHDEKIFKTGLSARRVVEASKKIQEQKIKSNDSYLRISAHPSDLTIQEIKDTCLGWSREGWVPDVIVIDYADLLVSDKKGWDKRDQIGDIWSKLRGLSQKYHCLVMTATQSDTAAYNAYVLNRSNFSETKAKNAHVTGMIGLCQTMEEKENGIMRLNWVVLREDEFIETRCVHIATCLSLANMCVKSCW